MNGIGPASLFILVSNIGLSLAGLFLAPQIIERCLFRPVEFARGLRRATLVTSGFVHADLPHLLFNMLTFWFFGPPLERRIGTPMFVLLYAAGLLVSQYGSYRKQRHNPQYATLGASGAISAVLFANIVYWPTNTLILMFLPLRSPPFRSRRRCSASPTWPIHGGRPGRAGTASTTTRIWEARWRASRSWRCSTRRPMCVPGRWWRAEAL